MELDCVLDEVKADRNQTWAILADYVRTRTPSGVMHVQEQAGQELYREYVEREIQL